MKHGEEEDGIFVGVHFILLGFDDPIHQSQVQSKLVNGGGVDAGGGGGGGGGYTPLCTHLIVNKDKIVYNHSDCALARAHGKTVVTALWVDHCIDIGVLLDAASILYTPLKDLNGIPGAKALSICLTGYQRQDRDDIMNMVGLMGAHFSKPLVANKVTHLICYKFEGEKYELAKKLKKIKLVNHCWLQDCLRAWEIIPECNYNKSGYELEIMEAEAKDSEEETEENKCTRTLGQYIEDTISKSHLRGEKDARVSKEAEISVATGQDEAGKNILSEKVEGNVHDKRSGSSPRSSNIQGGEYTCQGFGANIYERKCESSLNPVTEGKITPSDATTPVVQSYSRKPIGSSPISKFSGVLSNYLHGSPRADSEQLKCKVRFESTQQIDQINCNVDSGNTHGRRNDSELHIQMGGNLKLPVKRKSSVSNVCSKSPFKEATNLNDCATGSPSTRPAVEEFLPGRSQMKCGSLNGNDDNCFEKHDVQRPASNHSAKRFKSKPLRIDNGALNLELHSSRTSFSGGSEFPSGLKQSNRDPEPSLLGLNRSNFRTEHNIGKKEAHSLIDFQFDKNAGPVEEFQNPMASSLKPISGTDESKGSVDLGVQNGCTNDIFSRSLSKRTVKKGFGSKSKLSSAIITQKALLCLKTGNGSDEVMVFSGDGKEAEYGKNTGVIAEMTGPLCKAETLIEKKVTVDLVRRNKGENAAPSEGDETETPNEEFGAKLVNAAREEILPANAAKVAYCSTFEVVGDTAFEENALVILEKDGPEVVVIDIGEKDEVGGTIKKDRLVKERNKVVKKSMKSSASLVKRMDKSGREKAVGPEKINNEENMEVKKENIKQGPPKKQKSNTVLLDREDKSVYDEEKIEVMENRKQDPAKNQKINVAVLDKEEKSVNETEDDKPIERIHLIQGKQIEIQKILHTDGAAISKNDEHRVVARNDCKSGVVGGLNRNHKMGKGRKRVLNENKKPSLSVSKGFDVPTKVQEVEEMMELKKRKANGSSSTLKDDLGEDKSTGKGSLMQGKKTEGKINLSVDAKRSEKVDIVKATNDGKLKSEMELKKTKANGSSSTLKDDLGEDKFTGKGSLMQGKKTEGKINLSVDAKRSEKVDIVKATNDGKLKSEIAKDVNRLASKSKSKTTCLKKAHKYMEEDKENMPTETGTLGAKSGKRKRDTVDTVEMGKDADGMLLGEGSKRERLEPVLFILSGHRLQRKEFQQIIRRLKGKVCRDSHCWSYQATHLILPDPIRRTEKFFAAAASGRWILKTDYLVASNQAGKLLPEEPYEWFNSGFSEDGAINLEAPRKWRLLRERTGHGAFYKMRIIIYGECIAPSLDTLKRVVKAGDGVILATCPPYTRFLEAGVDFAVVSAGTSCTDSWVQEFLRHGIPCVVADYLVEYVCKTGCSLEKHVLYKTHAWAEKSFAKLASWSDEIVENDDCTPTPREDDDDISCHVCKSRDRAQVMLICGDESGAFGCGVGIHIDCCDPPFEAVPEEDWFCQKCNQLRDTNHPKKKTKKGSRKPH